MSKAKQSKAKQSKPCLVCDHPNPSYEWTDMHGEGACIQCGTPYQLKGGALQEGESYPRINVNMDKLNDFRRYWQATKQKNGFGTYWDLYHSSIKQRNAFLKWVQEHGDKT